MKASILNSASALEKLILMAKEYDLAIEVRAWRGQAPVACPEGEDLKDYLQYDTHKLFETIQKRMDLHNIANPRYDDHQAFEVLCYGHLTDTEQVDHNWQELRDWWYPQAIAEQEDYERIVAENMQREAYLNSHSVFDVLNKFPYLWEKVHLYSNKRGEEELMLKEDSSVTFHWRDGVRLSLYFKVTHKL